MTRRGLRAPLAAAAGLVLLALAARPAEARIMDLHIGGQAGGITGWGTTSRTPDFFEQFGGGGLGFQLGFKLLVFDLSANFTQIINGSGFAGTLTQFQLAFVIDVPVGPYKLPDGQSQNIIRPSLAGAFGFGTKGPVDPPLDARQLADKGVIGQAKIAYEYFLNPFLGVGAEALFGYHYFLGGQTLNASQDHSSGYHLAGFGTVTFHIGF